MTYFILFGFIHAIRTLVELTGWLQIKQAHWDVINMSTVFHITASARARGVLRCSIYSIHFCPANEWYQVLPQPYFQLLLLGAKTWHGALCQFTHLNSSSLCPRGSVWRHCSCWDLLGVSFHLRVFNFCQRVLRVTHILESGKQTLSWYIINA